MSMFSGLRREWDPERGRIWTQDERPIRQTTRSEYHQAKDRE